MNTQQQTNVLDIPNTASIKSDTAITGKMYKKLDAYSESGYFTSTNQFKTCKSFKAYLLAKYGIEYQVFISK